MFEGKEQMRGRIARLAVLAGAAVCLGSMAGRSQSSDKPVPQQIAASIEVRQTNEPVSKYEFGMFIEHIGSLVYRSLWSEMLDDRKFYFPIDSQPEATGPRAGFPGMRLRKWRPVGPDSAVTMDKEDPFVGDQSPRVELDSSPPHGIRQSGLALVAGKTYVGRIWLRGTPGAKVKVSLIWGDGEHDRQTVSIAALTSTYRKFPLSFSSSANSTDAALEITGTGSGLVGHSMGGYGATRIGMKHPDVFGSLYIMSPCCLSARPFGPPPGADASKYVEMEKQFEQSVAALHSPADSAGMQFFQRAQLASAAAWSPDPKNPPLYLDLPMKDGVPQPDVLAKWAANAPLAFIDQYIENLGEYHAIAEDVGDQDGLRFDTQNLHETLESYGIRNSFEMYHGTHTSAVADRFQNHVIPFFNENLCATDHCR